MTENTYIVFCVYNGASQVKDLPANAGDSRDVCSIPGLGRFPGEGNDNPLQYFLLGKSHRGTWQAIVHRITESDTTEHTHTNHSCYLNF